MVKMHSGIVRAEVSRFWFLWLCIKSVMLPLQKPITRTCGNIYQEVVNHL